MNLDYNHDKPFSDLRTSLDIQILGTLDLPLGGGVCDVFSEGLIEDHVLSVEVLQETKPSVHLPLGASVKQLRNLRRSLWDIKFNIKN